MIGFYQEGMTDGTVAFPNYSFPPSSGVLIKNGVIQDSYFIQYINSVLQQNEYITTVCALDRYLKQVVDSKNGLFGQILESQYGGLANFMNNSGTSFPNLSLQC
jgi:hypothetical protein